MARLIQINIAKLRDSMDSPLLADFVAQLDQVNTQAESSEGFYWRLKDDTGNATALSESAPWGADYIVNMSAWKDAASLMAFVYKQADHASVMRERKKWFEQMSIPHFAMWWLNDDQTPTLADAKRRLDHLYEHGETPYAFTFRSQFTAQDSIKPQWYSQTILRLGDSALIHAQRLAQWCGHGPMLEEDIALANIGLDHLGQARMLLTRAGQVEGYSRDEDDLAYWRNDQEFFNYSLVELPNSSAFGQRDYAVTITRLALYSYFMLLKWQQLTESTDSTVAAVAQKALKETRYHAEHSAQWLIRFGCGTAESKQRAQSAVNQLWRYTEEFFVDDAVNLAAAESGLGGLNRALKPLWLNQVQQLLQQADLLLPKPSEFLSQGTQGVHTENLSHLLADMQSVARQHPGANW